jgi:hypothetical protein
LNDFYKAWVEPSTTPDEEISLGFMVLINALKAVVYYYNMKGKLLNKDG